MHKLIYNGILFYEIPGFENYLISKAGNIINAKTFKIRKEAFNGKYLIVGLPKTIGGISKTYLIHKLLAITFIPNCRPIVNNVINHKDGNKLNNDLSNLEWCTQSYNIKHAYRTGLKKSYLCKETAANTKKFTDISIVNEIRELRNQKMKVKDISLRYNISLGLVSKIINYITPYNE